ncbi:MAG: class II aldolase/adducin family protein [Subdoligranulum sp.]|nr:class II aldolase/adducin family protein [Subdoligranulum sp.]
MINCQIKQVIVDMTLRCYSEKLFAGTSGNLSVYDRETGYMYITPGSYPYEKLTADDIMVMTLDGEKVDGVHNQSSEWRMHAAVYREMPGVGAVINTHSHYATSFAVNRQPVPVILIEMVPFLGGDVPVAEFAIPGTEAVGSNAVAVLGDRNACLMANHGVLAIGADLEQAHIRAVYVEDAAKICAIAKSNRDPVFVIDDKDVAFMKNRGKKK